MQFVNLTPHAINVIACGPDGGDLVIPPSGQVARLATQRVALDPVNGVPVHQVRFGVLVDLPAPAGGVVYIASALVADAAAQEGRQDVFSPDTSPAGVVRDAAGQIVGVRGLAAPSGGA